MQFSNFTTLVNPYQSVRFAFFFYFGILSNGHNFAKNDRRVLRSVLIDCKSSLVSRTGLGSTQFSAVLSVYWFPVYPFYRSIYRSLAANGLTITYYMAKICKKWVKISSFSLQTPQIYQKNCFWHVTSPNLCNFQILPP